MSIERFHIVEEELKCVKKVESSALNSTPASIFDAAVEAVEVNVIDTEAVFCRSIDAPLVIRSDPPLVEAKTLVT
tara:strand:- start:10 stop:234 length:225 start_codon:yes stop_codon:yes gene_type:complete